MVMGYTSVTVAINYSDINQIIITDLYIYLWYFVVITWVDFFIHLPITLTRPVMIKIRHIPTSNNPAATLAIIPMITFSETEKNCLHRWHDLRDTKLMLESQKLVLAKILDRDIEIQHTCTGLSISLKSYETFTTVSSV